MTQQPSVPRQAERRAYVQHMVQERDACVSFTLASTVQVDAHADASLLCAAFNSRHPVCSRPYGWRLLLGRSASELEYSLMTTHRC